MSWKLIPILVLVVIVFIAAAFLVHPLQGRGFAGANALPAPPLATPPPARMRILVIGGTSGIGRETVRLAVARGHAVTALSRRAPAQALRNERARYVQGDVTDPKAVAAVVAGEDVIVLAIGAAPTRQPVAVFSTGARQVVAAMGAAGVTRLIAVTGIGAGDSRGHGGFFYDHVVTPLLLRTIYEDKDREEAIIRGTTANWTIVRPGFLTDAPATGSYHVVRSLEGVRSGSIARADVAQFIVAAAESSLFPRATVLLSE
ncbi:MAG: SDR family NAD(P)-dependent oxidoreductase [Steroidobacteraceae bacterium]